MKCPKCAGENDASARFCSYCGNLLTTPGIPPVPESGKQHEDPERQYQALREEIQALRKLSFHFDERLKRLESATGVTAPQPEAATISAPAQAMPPSPAIEPTATPVAMPPPPPPPPVVTPHQEREWDQILGGNWLPRVGVIALLLGIAFFLRFTFDQSWPSPVLSVVLAALVGMVMLAGGHFLLKRDPILSQAVSGGGIGVLYLAVFGAFALFHLVGAYPAVVLLLLVSGGSAVLAIRQNSMALAIIAIVGAFTAPFVLGVSVTSAPGIRPTGIGAELLMYIVLVGIGIVALSTFRNWQWFTLLGLAGSIITFLAWEDRFGALAGLAVSQGTLTGIFLIFVGATMLYHIVWRRLARGFDYALMVLNAATYFLISYSLMWDQLRAWLGGFTFLLALFYGGLAYAVMRRGIESLRLRYFAQGIATSFLILAVPVQLGDIAWATIGWAAEASVLIWLAYRLRMPHLRFYGYTLFGLTGFRLVFFDTTINIAVSQPVLNERVLAFVVSIVLTYLTGYFLWRQTKMSRSPLKQPVVAQTLLISANVLTMWLIAAETAGYVGRWHSSYSGLATALFFAGLGGATVLYRLAWRRIYGLSDLVLLSLNAAFYFGIIGVLWQTLNAWMGVICLVFAIFHSGLAAGMLRRQAENARLSKFAAGIAVVSLSVAVPAQFGNSAWTTVVWAAEFAGLVWLSFRLNLSLLRSLSYALFVVIGGRLFFFDTPVDVRALTPILNARTGAFLTAIAATYGVAYLLWRFREKFPEWDAPGSFLIVAANFLTLWWLSFEVFDYFSARLAWLTRPEAAGPAGQSLRSAQNLALTSLWAVYAIITLVMGAVRRWRRVRLWAIGLLGVPIIKLFVWDIWALEMVYRIAAFVGLGILLTAGAYLFHRYSRTIRGFVVKK
ncbi:MAG: DUF2339 domain-containing protein [Chloroflexota bacterium]